MPVATTIQVNVTKLVTGDRFGDMEFHHHDQCGRKADRDEYVVAVFDVSPERPEGLRRKFPRVDRLTVTRELSTYGERLATEERMLVMDAMRHIKQALEFDSTKELLGMVTGRDGVASTAPRHLVSKAGWEMGDILTRAQTAVHWLDVEAAYVDALKDRTNPSEHEKAVFMATVMRHVIDDARRTAEDGPRDDGGGMSHRFAHRCAWDGTCKFLKDTIGWGGYGWSPLLAYETAAADVAAHGAEAVRS